MSLPSTDPQSGDLARKKLLLSIICIGLVVSALTIIVLPIPLPLPVKLMVGFTDLCAAAAIWLFGRQRLKR